MRNFQRKLSLVWFASLVLSGTAFADSVSSLRRELAQVQAPSRPGEMRLSQFRSGAGLTCELARKHLPAGERDSSAVSPAGSSAQAAGRAL